MRLRSIGLLRLAGLMAITPALSAAASPPGTPTGGSIFADHSARRVGDVLTVLVVESTAASKSTETKTNTSLGSELGSSGRLSFADFWNLDVGNSSLGEGTTSRRGDLLARITVRVVDVDPNGLLLVEGTRSVRVNGEEERIVLRGAVRPRDVREDNTVLSTFLADASIEYSGEGVLAQAERPGLFTRLLNWLF
jgi:flagellar L-ring protein precursor FlgH